MPLTIRRQSDFSGGTNTTDVASDIGPDELSGSQNCRISGRYLKNRLGQTKLNTNAVTGSGKVHSLYRFYKDDGTTRYTLGASGAKLFNWSATPTEITRSSGTWTSGVRIAGAAMLNKFFLMNGLESPQAFSSGSSSAAMGGTPPTSTNLLIASPTANRLFAANTSSKRIDYSALGNPEDWTTSNDAGFFLVPFSDGENTKAIFPLPSGAVGIWSNSSFHVLTGTDPGNFVRREVDPSIGCVSQQSIAAGNGGVYFLAQNHKVYWTNGGKPTHVSRKVDYTLENGSTGDYPNSVGWVEGSRYHLAIAASSGNNDTVLVKDWSVNPDKGSGWMIDKQINAASAAVDDGVTGQVYTGDYSGFVQQQDSGTTDNGTAVASYFDTADDDYSEMERRKKTKRSYVKVKPSGSYSMTVSVAKDGEALSTVGTVDLTPSSGVWDTGEQWDINEVWGGAQTHIVSKVSEIRNCRSLKHRFSISNPFEFYEYSTLLRLKFPR